MLLILYIVLATCSSYLADDIFPEALVFEGLGLSDIVNKSKPNENRNNSVIIKGDLHDALTTMDFHRYGFNLIITVQFEIFIYFDLIKKIQNTKLIPNTNQTINKPTPI